MLNQNIEDIKSKINEKVALCEDNTVLRNVLHFLDRSIFWKKKYWVTLDREDLSFNEWAVHLKEELMDWVNYIERLTAHKTSNQ